MRIGITSHHLELKGSGGSTYFRNLIRRINDIDKNNIYVLYAQSPKDPFYKEVICNPNIILRSLPNIGHWHINPVAIGLSSFKDRIEILHAQFFAPPLHRGKLVLTIYDLASFHFPEYFKAKTRSIVNTFVPLSAHRAMRIITISHFSKADIINFLGIPSERISVIYLAVDNSFCLSNDIDKCQEVTKRYGISGPYILSVGQIEPRKNLKRLIQAYELFRRKGKMDIKLVVVGKAGDIEEHIKINIDRSEYLNDVIITGYVSDSDLPKLYRLAHMFVYPSLYEGFGLPILEAMACGCPVITSNVASMPEVGGSAAIYIDPYNIEDIASSMLIVANSQEKRQKMCELGLRRAKNFSWETTARETMKVYQDVYEH